MSKHWARLRLRAPSIIYDWHNSEQEARDAIAASAEKNGLIVNRLQAVAFFPAGEPEE